DMEYVSQLETEVAELTTKFNRFDTRAGRPSVNYTSTVSQPETDNEDKIRRMKGRQGTSKRQSGLKLNKLVLATLGLLMLVQITVANQNVSPLPESEGTGLSKSVVS